MTFDDRIRKALEEAIPATPAEDPNALADQLIRRAGKNGGSGGPSGPRAALWIAVLAVIGLGIGWLIGSGGFGDSRTAASTIPAADITSVPTGADTIPTTVVPTSTPSNTMTTAVAPATTSPATTSPATTPPGTSPPTTSAPPATGAPPSIGSVSANPDPIWEKYPSSPPTCPGDGISTITATVIAPAGVQGVTYSWSGAGSSGSGSMTPAGGSYQASIGPFDANGDGVPQGSSAGITVEVTVADVEGRFASAETKLTVNDCTFG